MASIVKRKHKHKTTYLCFIRRKVFKTLRKTFQTRQDAQSGLDISNVISIVESQLIFLKPLG